VKEVEFEITIDGCFSFPSSGLGTPVPEAVLPVDPDYSP